jgi:hypothetical protein
MEPKYIHWTITDQIRTKVERVVEDEDSFRVLSTGEKIAVAMVLNRHDLLDQAWGSILECVHRLGPEWTDAALYIQRTCVFNKDRNGRSGGTPRG